VGTIAATSLVAMKRWHGAGEALDTLTDTLSWISSINIAARAQPRLKIARDPRLERWLEAYFLTTGTLSYLLVSFNLLPTPSF
ncbi:hypothetical protein PHYSODRAFT_489003, partial [Phytophthora sojae]